MFLWNTKQKRRITVGACSDVGWVRSENQDAYGCFPSHPASEVADRLFVVADGMGGHTRGREASQAAVHIVQQTYFRNPGQPVAERLQHAFVAANASIYQAAHEHGAFDRMGTTCTALSIVDSQIYIAHVGDSRAYHINRRRINKLTRDHSLAAALQREGIMNAQEARTHPQRHVLIRALGMEQTLEIDLLHTGTCRPGESFLLCTDGLAGVTEKEIQSIALLDTPQRACEKLVQVARERDGYDNITALLLRIS